MNQPDDTGPERVDVSVDDLIMAIGAKEVGLMASRQKIALLTEQNKLMQAEIERLGALVPPPEGTD